MENSIISNISDYFTYLRFKFLNSFSQIIENHNNFCYNLNDLEEEKETFFNFLRYSFFLVNNKNICRDFFYFFVNFQKIISTRSKIAISGEIIKFLTIIEILEPKDILDEEEKLIFKINNYLQINTLFSTGLIYDESLNFDIFKKRIFKFYFRIVLNFIISDTNSKLNNESLEIKDNSFKIDGINTKLIDLIRFTNEFKPIIFKILNKAISMKMEYNNSNILCNNVYILIFYILTENNEFLMDIIKNSKKDFLKIYYFLLILNFKVVNISLLRDLNPNYHIFEEDYLNIKLVTAFADSTKNIKISEILQNPYLNQNQLKILNKYLFMELIINNNNSNYILMQNLPTQSILKYQCKKHNLKKLNFIEIYNVLSLVFYEIKYLIDENNKIKEIELSQQLNKMQITETNNYIENLIDLISYIRNKNINNNLLEKLKYLEDFLKILLENKNLFFMKIFDSDEKIAIIDNNNLDISYLNVFIQLENFFIKNSNLRYSLNFLNQREKIINSIFYLLIDFFLKNQISYNLSNEIIFYLVFLLRYDNYFILGNNIIENLIEIGYKKDSITMFKFFNNYLFNSNQEIKSSIIFNLCIHNLMILKNCSDIISNVTPYDDKEYSNLIYYSLNLLELQIWGDISNRYIINYYCNNPKCNKKLKKSNILICSKYMYLCNNCNQEHISIYYKNNSNNLVSVSKHEDIKIINDNLNYYLKILLDFTNFNINYDENRIHIYLRNIVIILNFFDKNYVNFIVHNIELINIYTELINDWLIKLKIVNYKFFLDNKINIEYSKKIKKFTKIIMEKSIKIIGEMSQFDLTKN